MFVRSATEQFGSIPSQKTEDTSDLQQLDEVNEREEFFTDAQESNAKIAVAAFGDTLPKTPEDLIIVSQEGELFNPDIDGDGTVTQRDVSLLNTMKSGGVSLKEASRRQELNANHAITAFGDTSPEIPEDLIIASQEGELFNPDIDGDGTVTQRDVDLINKMKSEGISLKEANQRLDGETEAPMSRSGTVNELGQTGNTQNEGELGEGAGTEENANEAVEAFKGGTPPETIEDLEMAADEYAFNTDIDGDGQTTQRDVDVVRHMIENGTTFYESNTAVPIQQRELGSDNGGKLDPEPTEDLEPVIDVVEDEAVEGAGEVIGETAATALGTATGVIEFMGIIVVGELALSAVESFEQAQTLQEQQTVVDNLSIQIAELQDQLNQHLESGRPQIDPSASPEVQAEQRQQQEAWDAELVRLTKEIESALQVGEAITSSNSNLDGSSLNQQSGVFIDTLQTRINGASSPTVKDFPD